MADTDISITAGAGTKIDTRTVGAGVDEHRQVVVVGDPATAANVQTVSAGGAALVDTELPAAAALSDSIGNPTSPMVGSGGMLYDGTDWRRMRTMDDAGGNLATSVGILVNVPHLHDTGSSVTPMKRGAELTDADVGAWMPGAALMMYNGTNWSRCRGDTTNGLDVDVTRMPVASTATLTNVAASATSVTLDAANSARLGLTIFNDSTSALYVKLGATASATSFTVKMAGGAYWEMPPSPVYTGVIDGIWVTATGNARVTDITA